MILYLFLESRRKIDSYIDIGNDRDIFFFFFIFNLKFNVYFKTLIEFINEELYKYHDEMIDFLQDRFDIKVLFAIINQMFKKYKIS